MALDRTVFNASIDDSGAGTDGTIGDKAWYEAAILNPIDALVAGTTPGSVGYWQDIPFNAAHFYTPTAGATWTIPPPGTWAYTRIGKTAIVSLLSTSGTITGAPVRLYITVPIAAARGHPFSFFYAVTGPGLMGGTGVGILTGTTIDLLRDIVGTAFPAGGGVYIYFTMTYSVA